MAEIKTERLGIYDASLVNRALQIFIKNAKRIGNSVLFKKLAEKYLEDNPQVAAKIVGETVLKAQLIDHS